MNTISSNQTIYPRSGDASMVYLNQVVHHPKIKVGDFTFYHDFFNDPRDFEKNNVLYQYPILNDWLIIGKFCSIACGAKFLLNGANHSLTSLSTYPFPLIEEWNHGLPLECNWQHRGDIRIGHDVWIGYEAVILSGVTIGNGAIIGTRATVTKDVPPYTIVGGTPARRIRKRYSDETIQALEKIAWWDWPHEKISKAVPYIQAGNIKKLLELSTL